MRRALGALLVAGAAAGSGCVSYNDACAGFADHPGEIVGYLLGVTYLDKPNARQANNVVGQVAADAYAAVFADGGVAASGAPVFGIINGGDLRGDGLCVSRNVLQPPQQEPSGVPANTYSMTAGVMHEILLFQDIVYAVDLSECDVYQVFEHSVSSLYPAPAAITKPSGQFLQVSGAVSMQVDCGRPPGQRVTQLSIEGQPLSSAGCSATRMFRAAMPSYLLNGGDGYTVISQYAQDPSRNPAQAQTLGGIDANIAVQYMQQTYATATVPAQTQARVQFAVDGGQPTCTVPPPPSG